MKILIKTIVKAKNKPPVTSLKEHKFEGDAQKAIETLMDKKTPYFEIHDKDEKTITVYEIPGVMKNYVKKVHKIE